MAATLCKIVIPMTVRFDNSIVARMDLNQVCTDCTAGFDALEPPQMIFINLVREISISWLRRFITTPNMTATFEINTDGFGCVDNFNPLQATVDKVAQMFDALKA